MNQRRYWHERHRTIAKLSGESMTQPSHAEASDVNVIVQRYQRTGELPRNPRGIEGRFMDCTPFQEDITEAYNKSLETVDRITGEIEAEEAERQRAEQEAAEKSSTTQTPKAEEASPEPSPTTE